MWLTSRCVTVTPAQTGTQTLALRFAGASGWTASSAAAFVSIVRDETTLVYTGASVVANGLPQTLSARLTDPEDRLPIAGKTITFSVGTSSASGVTDAAGLATASITLPATIGTGPIRLFATFAGDANWLPATTTAPVLLYAARFGGKAEGAAVIMAKHSADTRLLLAALPILERDLTSDRQFAQAFAIAFDQLLLSLDQLQRYGSQVCAESGHRPFLCSVETPSRLDERHTAIGLDPLREYLDLVSKMLYKNEPVRVPGDDELQ